VYFEQISRFNHHTPRRTVLSDTLLISR
jgi:hypothetical protein